MAKTPFPILPAEVVPLTIHEFTFEPPMTETPSLDVVCGRFPDDTNRALVWFLRFRALSALSARADMEEWLRSHSRTSPAVSEVATTFELNDRWEFVKDGLCSAVKSIRSRNHQQ